MAPNPTTPAPTAIPATAPVLKVCADDPGALAFSLALAAAPLYVGERGAARPMHWTLGFVCATNDGLSALMPFLSVTVTFTTSLSESAVAQMKLWLNWSS